MADRSQTKTYMCCFVAGEVNEPTSAAFLQKYDLGAPSSAARLLAALTEKELLLETKSLNGSSYCVYNVFFSRWLEGL